MDTDRKVLHFKYQSLGPYETFLSELLINGNQQSEFWFVKEAVDGKNSPIPSKKFGELKNLWAQRDFSGFDLIHAHFGTSALLALPLVQRSKLPLVVSFYGHDYTAFPRRWFGLGRFLLRAVFRKADAIVAMSSVMRDELVRLGADREKVQIALPGMRKLGYKKGLITRVERLLMGSSLKEKKNHALVFHALKLLKDRGITPRLWVLGDGPLKANLEALVKNLGIEDQVIFEGHYQNGSDLKRHIASCDLFLHPSRRARNGDGEGVPTAILEALDCSMPVITSRHAGMDQLFGDVVTLVDEYSAQDLCETLYEICLRPEKVHSMQQKALSWAEKNLNPEESLRKWREIYNLAGKHEVGPSPRIAAF